MRFYVQGNRDVQELDEVLDEFLHDLLRSGRNQPLGYGSRWGH